mmetsp:Transcript_13033/g.23895  ORF Transcript_13033/g.23895 Transcript_13033/m.23895 type:complete len:553 (+) Transcript_13033:601-2259(+)
MDASFRNQGTYNLVQWSDGSSSSYTEPTFSGLVYEYSAWARLESIRALVYKNNAPSPPTDKTVEDMEVSSKEETEPRKTKKKWVGAGFAWTEEEDEALLKGVGKYGLDFERIKKEDDGNVLGDRTPETLRIRFRYKFPAKYKELMAVTPRKQGLLWTSEEDAALKRGVKEHGTDWDKILKSENKVLGRRTLVALQRRWQVRARWLTQLYVTLRSTAPSSPPSATTLATIADFYEDGDRAYNEALIREGYSPNQFYLTHPLIEIFMNTFPTKSGWTVLVSSRGNSKCQFWFLHESFEDRNTFGNLILSETELYDGVKTFGKALKIRAALFPDRYEPPNPNFQSFFTQFCKKKTREKFKKKEKMEPERNPSARLKRSQDSVSPKAVQHKNSKRQRITAAVEEPSKTEIDSKEIGNTEEEEEEEWFSDEEEVLKMKLKASTRGSKTTSSSKEQRRSSSSSSDDDNNSALAEYERKNQEAAVHHQSVLASEKKKAEEREERARNKHRNKHKRQIEALTLQIEAQRLQIEEKDASIERKNDIIKKLISVVEEGLGAG